MQTRHRRRHLQVWLILAVLLPAIFGAALLVRLGQRADHPPVRLAPP